MASVRDLVPEGFRACRVTATTLNINHPDPAGLGPFCRLAVEDTAPTRPGVYAWTVDDAVMYIGKADELRQVVHGARMQRAYNDYTYVPASKVAQRSSPRVRVNGLLNRALCEGSSVEWWWVETHSAAMATTLEATLIDRWSPPWNRSNPTVRSRADHATAVLAAAPAGQTVHLFCGLNGSGKSTLAQALAMELPAIRFSLDEWMLRLHGLRYDDPQCADRLVGCKELIWATAEQVLNVGRDVVLDWNHWSRAQRAESCQRAGAGGHRVVVHYLDVRIEVAIERMNRRNASPRPDAHEIEEAGIRHLASIFEPPGAEEGFELVVHP